MKKTVPSIAATTCCVLGDMDLVRPLGLAGLKCAVAVQPGAPPQFSRFVFTSLPWFDPWKEPEQLVETLMRFGAAQPTRPVLFFESDGELLLVSRNRDRLKQVFRFAIADQTLVENLVDKERFQELAGRLSLPVPPAQRLRPEEDLKAAELKLRFPIVVKPLTRRPEIWRKVVKEGKALRIDTRDELQRLWPELAAAGVSLLAQEMIAGPETSIESYHVYVDEHDRIAGEFTGRKVRTYPLEYGDSTALETTNAADVVKLGRELVKRLHLRGVAKFDFKRAADGRLYLLEVNPRFNLWHHLGALAGVNLPALVYGDLVGQQVQPAASARPGVRWCRLWQDAQAARATEVSLARWLPWALGCEAKRLLSWDDPMPFVGGVIARLIPGYRRRKTKANSGIFEAVDRGVASDSTGVRAEAT